VAEIITTIPETVDTKERWLVEYWANVEGVSAGRLEQAIGVVGPEMRKVRQGDKDGYRLAIRDDAGVARLAVKISLEKGGFGVSLPYHPSKNGWLHETPLEYGKAEFGVPLSQMKHYIVDSTVKLSMHMDGFVQFSDADGKKIVSGYNQELQKPKGIGLKAPYPIIVTSGPLVSGVIHGLKQCKPLDKRPAELFELDDFWHHPRYSREEDTSYNVEIFMFGSQILNKVRQDGSKRMLKMGLPFRSEFRFEHDLRVLELPHQSIFLGVIVSRFPPLNINPSGYVLGGPGLGGPGEQMRCIAAQYPRPDAILSDQNPISLNFTPSPKQ